MVPIPHDVATWLFETLKRPSQNSKGDVGYNIWMNTSDAYNLRMALGDALEGKTDGRTNQEG